MARSSVRYALPLAKLSLLVGLALSGCGGDASSTTGPTMAVPAPEAATVRAAAPAPAPPPPPRPQVRVSTIANGPGSISITDQGARGYATASPAWGYRFLGWAASSSDCPGEMTNPCSFAFDRNKTIVANFGR
jgi:Divergent InlB B-repeat domain